MLEERELLPDALARDVVAHLCSEACHGIGETVELCESRGDCVVVVRCGCCRTSFTLNEDQYAMLVAWSATRGVALACGIAPLPG